MANSTDPLASGRERERIGDLPGAEAAYRQLLSKDPRQVEALFRLGVVSLKLRKSQEAVSCLSRVVEMRPEFAEAWSSLGVALAAQGEMPVAENAFRRATALGPERSEFHRNLGNLLAESGNYAEAETSLRRALGLQPDHRSTLLALARMLRSQKKLDEAAAALRHLVHLEPGNVQVVIELSEVLAEAGRTGLALEGFQRAIDLAPETVRAWIGLGVVLGSSGRSRDAVDAFRRAVRMVPDDGNVHANLGMALVDCGLDDDALEHLRTALRLCPNQAQTHLVLGGLLLRRGEIEAATESYRAALRHQPNYVEALNCLGVALERQGQFDEASACLEQALRISPDYPQAHRSLALIELRNGNWEGGWKRYEWRTKCPGGNWQRSSEPLWDGSNLAGRSILLHCEQGLGDTIQFIRFAQVVKERGGRVVVACQPPLLPLLSRCAGIDDLVGLDGKLPTCDVRAPLMSLPQILGVTHSSVPGAVPYLNADGGRVAQWARRLSAGTGIKVGIVWRGSPQYLFDQYRSVSLAAFEPLGRLPGVQFVALQREHGREELSRFADRIPVRDVASELDESAGAFVDTAALMCNLDLVITVDTSLAHLAGALGVRVWLALAHAADWRWLRDREDSVWYPSMRLFRQSTAGRWDDVFQRMAECLGPLARGEVE